MKRFNFGYFLSMIRLKPLWYLSQKVRQFKESLKKQWDSFLILNLLSTIALLLLTVMWFSLAIVGYVHSK